MFWDEYHKFLTEFGKGRKMVLSTSLDDRVSSRMMSVVLIKGLFYFQTDVTLGKYRQLKGNPNVALCIDNIQIEGVCMEIGHPMDNDAFCKHLQQCFKGSYNAYTALKNERLFVVKPIFIERWVYKDGVPYIERFDTEAQRYEINQYIGT